jgi:hypothetical protein
MRRERQRDVIHVVTPWQRQGSFRPAPPPDAGPRSISGAMGSLCQWMVARFVRVFVTFSVTESLLFMIRVGPKKLLPLYPCVREAALVRYCFVDLASVRLNVVSERTSGIHKPLYLGVLVGSVMTGAERVATCAKQANHTKPRLKTGVGQRRNESHSIGATTESSVCNSIDILPPCERSRAP